MSDSFFVILFCRCTDNRRISELLNLYGPVAVVSDLTELNAGDGVIELLAYRADAAVTDLEHFVLEAEMAYRADNRCGTGTEALLQSTRAACLVVSSRSFGSILAILRMNLSFVVSSSQMAFASFLTS